MRAAAALAWLATLLYPLAVWFGLARFEPRWVAMFLLALALLRAIASREKVWLAAAAGACGLVLASWFSNDGLPLKLYPVLVNLALYAINDRFTPSVAWNVWPLAGWGIGLAFHGLAVFFLGSGSSLRQRMFEHERRLLEAETRAR